MKKLVTITLIVSLMVTMLGSVQIYGLTYQQVANEATQICEAIGLVVGTGSGLTEEYLATTPKRYGGAKLLVALRGNLTVASGFSFAQNFNDYMDLGWMEGRNILGYLKANPTIGYNGYPDGSFKPNNDMTVKEYYKLMLVSLGYVENVDFSWKGNATMPSVMEMATTVGLVWLEENETFTMEKLCVATYEALMTNRKSSSETLAKYLVNQGAIDANVAMAYDLIQPAIVIGAEPELVISEYLNYEIGVITGETAITLELENGRFVEAIGENSSETQLLIDGIKGDLDTSTSFNSSVNLDYNDITRVSDTMVTISIPASKTYRISGDEVIGITIEPALIEENIINPIKGTVTIVDVGAGTMEEPWLILRPMDLKMMEIDTIGYFEIDKNLDFEGMIIKPIVGFQGHLEGNNFTMKNYSIASGKFIGLFEKLQNATIENLVISQVTVIGAGNNGDYTYAGALAGELASTTLNNVVVSNVTVSGARNVGGLAGIMVTDVEIINCKVNEVTLKDAQFAGGLVGFVSSGSSHLIEDCIVTNGHISAIESVGGLIGQNYDTLSILNSSVNSDTSSGFYTLSYPASVGGLVGTNTGKLTINGSESFGTLQAHYRIGGILGFNKSSGEVVLTNNYGGVSAYQYVAGVLLGVPNVADFHRILGKDEGSSTLSNTGYTNATLKLSSEGNNVAAWTSDAASLDGSDFSWMFLIPEFEIPQPIRIIEPIPEINFEF